ncbi:DUF6415 family natural product biosynthesis protein [Streptomyces sp. NPDC004647]|uniref:DUF6415 family natural product biosynthesis protein n=1 Tax=Streptomyces sp. NPDC004647 TaxID=3154671 RepID=UPI0033A10577
MSRWEPPLGTQELESVLAKVRGWAPLIVEAVFEDINCVLGDQTPRASELDELAMRLRANLMQLVNIAVAGRAEQDCEELPTLIERAHALRSEDLPDDYRKGLGHTRRLARVTNELLEHLIQAKHVRDEA